MYVQRTCRRNLRVVDRKNGTEIETEVETEMKIERERERMHERKMIKGGRMKHENTESRRKKVIFREE